MEDLCVKKFDRAIEVGCGDGRFTRDHLIKNYTVVDMFDIDAPVIERVKLHKMKYDAIKDVERASMQEYEFKHKYNGIFLRWTIGYLNKD